MTTQQRHRRTARRTASPTLSRPRATPCARIGRRLFESVSQRMRSGSPLNIDRDACIIYGVKVLGRYSKNTYGLDVECTEYSPAAMKQALDLYEDADVFTDHIEDRKNPGTVRGVREAFGVLRNVRMDGDCIRADLHYKPSHELAEAVLDDIELRHGTFGLSHNAKAGREVVRNNRLIIEEITLVRSVDLVTKPATNRNLWESQAMLGSTTTLRKLLTKIARKAEQKAERELALDLLEDDAMPMDEPVDDVPADPAVALSDAFLQSGNAILAAIFAGDVDEAQGMSKLKELLKAHGKLTAEPEVEEADDEEEDYAEGEEDTVKNKEEADDEPDGDEKKEKKESHREKVTRLERELAARKLCDAADVKPSDELLEAISGLEEAKAKKLIEQFKGKAETPSAPARKRPRSAATGRDTSESHREKVGAGSNGTTKLADWMNRLRG